MNDIYHRLHLAGETQDGAEILQTLAAMHSGKLKNDLRLMNFYREVPVSYGAEVLTIEESHVELLVHQVQAVVIAHEKLTVLKSSHFRKDVMASVTYVNVEKSRVVLSNLGYTVVRADRRMSMRVQLGVSIDAAFSAPEHDGVHGRLHDMSLTGMSINVARDPSIPMSQKGELSIALPTGTITVPVPAENVQPRRRLSAGVRDRPPARAGTRHLAVHLPAPGGDHQGTERPPRRGLGLAHAF